jgi:hypothetical protein
VELLLEAIVFEKAGIENQNPCSYEYTEETKPVFVKKSTRN